MTRPQLGPVWAAAAMLSGVATNARQVNPAMDAYARQILARSVQHVLTDLATCQAWPGVTEGSAWEAAIEGTRMLETMTTTSLLHEVADCADALSRCWQWLSHPGYAGYAMDALLNAPAGRSRALPGVLARHGWTRQRCAAATSFSYARSVLREESPDGDGDPGAVLAWVESHGVPVREQPAKWAGATDMGDVLAGMGPVTAAQVETAVVLLDGWTGTLGDLADAARRL